mgnify:CR=1 FL=1
MTLLDHLKDPNFWSIFFELAAWALLGVLILVVIFWLLDKIKSKPDLTQRLADQELWQKRFKK